MIRMSLAAMVSRNRYSKKAIRCKRNGCFARTSDTLYNHDAGSFISDDCILIALNRGDDIFHFIIRRLTQLLLENIVMDANRILDHEFHPTLADPVLTFQQNFSSDFPGWCFIKRFS